jgi:phytoene synthase
MATELELAYDHCRRITKQEAKNFYYAFRTLPSAKRRAIYAAYAFCHHCDDIADGDFPLDEKRRLLADTRERLSALHNGPTGDPLFTALGDASRAFEIPLGYLEEVVDGVEMDLTWTRFQDFDQLRTYCHKVASVVGLICIEVFGYEDPTVKEYAVDLGLAMQFTNILRDVKEDAERGRIYIPLDEMASFGYSEQELMDGVINDAFRDLMRFQAARARHYFASGKRLIPLLSPESRACPGVLHGVYSTLLDRIESSGFNVFERRIGLSKREKILITAKLWARSLIPAVPLLRR